MLFFDWILNYCSIFHHSFCWVFKTTVLVIALLWYCRNFPDLHQCPPGDAEYIRKALWLHNHFLYRIQLRKLTFFFICQLFLLNLLYLLSLWNRWWFRTDCDWCVRILACTFAIKAHGFEPSQKSLTTGLSTCRELGEHMDSASVPRFPSPLLLPQPPPVYEVILTGILQRLVWLARTCFIFKDGGSLQADILNTSAVEKYDHKSLWLLFFWYIIST